MKLNYDFTAILAMFGGIFVIACILIGVFLFGSYSIDQTELYEACQEKGYEWKETSTTEEGYVNCCTDVYVGHIKSDTICKVYSKEELLQ